ncbi:MAG: PaaI family thioesterase [Pseudomonadota bacterium]|nr:PaaI family thioesterase [Pseudomonadota bacterium]
MDERDHKLTNFSSKDFELIAKRSREIGSPQAIIDVIPYGKFIGVEASVIENEIQYTMDRKKTNIGNPSLPAIHGGVIGGFLELASAIESIYVLEINAVPKVVDFSIDYLRPGRYKKMYASCTVMRQGRKLINVSSNAWQENKKIPVATARCHFLVP